MNIDEALYQLKQRIKMHELEGTTSNENEREKALLDYITNLQEKYNEANNAINWWSDKAKELQEENEKLKNGYCELKVKCNNGECDCTNEEYEGMVQANMRGILLLDDCKSKIDKAREMIRFIVYNSERPLTITELNKVYNILGGDDNGDNK